MDAKRKSDQTVTVTKHDNGATDHKVRTLYIGLLALLPLLTACAAEPRIKQFKRAHAVLQWRACEAMADTSVLKGRCRAAVLDAMLSLPDEPAASNDNLEATCHRGSGLSCRRVAESLYRRGQWSAAISMFQRGCDLGNLCACLEEAWAPSHGPMNASTLCSLPPG